MAPRRRRGRPRRPRPGLGGADQDHFAGRAGAYGALDLCPRRVDEGPGRCRTDPKGRVLASDQGGKGLVRITPAPIGTSDQTIVEKVR